MNYETSFGSKLTIENDTFLIFEDKKIDLKKITSIGDFWLNEDIKTLENLKNRYFGFSIPLFIYGIYTYFNPPMLYVGTKIEEPDKILFYIIWVGFVFLIFNGYSASDKIKKINSIDKNKNDHPLNIEITVPNSNGDNTKKLSVEYVCCKGTINELKEIKTKILEAIERKSIS
jgi:hypothetical protein